MIETAVMNSAMRAYLWETAPIVALKLDLNDCVADANAAALRLLGKKSLQQPFIDQLVLFGSPPDLKKLLEQPGTVHLLTLKTASDTPESLHFRFFPLPQGTLVLGCPDFGEQERLCYQVLDLNRELNDRTRELHQINAELQALNKLKNEFLGMAAHDLRSPTASILTYGENILPQADNQLPDDVRDYVKFCQKTAEGMLQIIEGFLDVSIIESGELRLNLAPASAKEILAGVDPMIRLVTANKQLTLVMDTTNDSRTLPVDSPKLQQVLINLVNNAVGHSHPGRSIRISAKLETDTLIFGVKDEGQGISPEDQALLFKTYGRADNHKTAGERSVGLGLAIASKVVQAHKGRIWVESVPGAGATFRFSIPAPPGH